LKGAFRLAKTKSAGSKKKVPIAEEKQEKNLPTGIDEEEKPELSQSSKGKQETKRKKSDDGDDKETGSENIKDLESEEREIQPDAKVAQYTDGKNWHEFSGESQKELTDSIRLNGVLQT
jgi:hypothetical protein